MKMWPLLLSSLLLISSGGIAAEKTGTSTGPDYDRETRLKNEIVDSILDGDPIDLEANGREFMAIDMEPDDDAKGGAIILHGRAFHPDWANVVQPLRTGLAANGWRTLSIQLPVLEKSAKYFDYVPLFPEANGRIQAAIDYLKEQGLKKIVIVAHSCGAHMANHRIQENGEAGIDAFVGIGMGATDYKQPMQEEFAMGKLSVPVLDVYAENDFPAVLRKAEERKALLKNEKSKQIVIPEAEHYFVDMGDPLVEAVSAWMDGL